MKDEIKEIMDEILWQFEKHPIDGDYLLKEKAAKTIYNYIINLQEEKDKYKNVIDKIKEIINNNAFFDPAMPNCMALGQKSTLEIKELLEEVDKGGEQ